MQINTNKQKKNPPLKALTALLALLVMVTSISFAAPANVTVNSKTAKFDLISVMNRQYIAGKDLKTFGLTETITGNTLTLKHKEVTFLFNATSNAVQVNGVNLTLDAKPFLRSGKAYYPMRFVLETMNYTLGHDAKKGNTVIKAVTKPEFPVTIKDEKANYTFKKPVDKIVSLAPSMTEILFAIGAGDMLVGRTKYCTYPAEASKIKSIGTLYEPDIESILALKPELVLAATHMNADVMKMLDKANILTATQKSPEKIDQIYTLIENLGIITGKDYTARALVSSLKGKVDRIANIANSIPKAERKTLYYVVGTGKSEYSAGSDTFISDVLTRAGAVNVASDVTGWSYSLEKLLSHNPEYIFGEGWAKDSMKGSSNYSALSALKNDKFIVVDGNLFAIPGPRVIDLGMKQVIETLYPSYAKRLQY